MTGLRDHLGWRRIPDVVVEVLAEELGPSLRWATATTTRTTPSHDR
jgi:hypothetical protein